MKLLISSLLAFALLDPDVGGTPSGSTGPTKAAPTISEGLSTPESVLYDAQADVYLVSNINGAPLAKDNNGFIAVMGPEDKAVTRFIEGGKNKVTLNAPKGMAINNGVLYVADIDTLRMFDRKTGAPKGEIAMPGTTFLNDVAVSADGTTLYVTDSGLKQGAKDFEPSGTDAIYAIKNGLGVLLLRGKDLGRPNGIVATADTLWMVTFGSNELVAIDLKTTKKGAVTKLPKGSLDGLVMLPNGEVLISSWESGTVYRGKPGGEFKPLLTDLGAPADIGYDTRRNRVLVPRFTESRVEAYPVTVSAAPPASAH